MFSGTPRPNRRDSFWSHRPSIGFGFGAKNDDNDSDFETEEPEKVVV